MLHLDRAVGILPRVVSSMTTLPSHLPPPTHKSPHPPLLPSKPLLAAVGRFSDGLGREVHACRGRRTVTPIAEHPKIDAGNRLVEGMCGGCEELLTEGRG